MVYQSGTDEKANRRAYRSQSRLKHAVKTMPRWKWRLLQLAMVVGAIGLVGQTAERLNAGPQAAVAPVVSTHIVSTETPPAGASSPASPVRILPDGSTPSAAQQSLLQAVTPYMATIGFSLFVGVVAGLVFRTFLRMALMLTTLIVGGAMALSYFHVMNIDLTAVKADTSQATSWLTDQGYRLKDMLFNALPSSTGATVGFLFGIKRR
jgi:uncharacterized membrane protein (Fun14 family)